MDTKTTIKLKSQGYEAEINLLGAELKSFKDPKGTQYMWNGNPGIWKRTSPILFPIVGNVRNDVTNILGRNYNLEKHGFVKNSMFEVEQLDESRASFTLRDTQATRAHYPFRFELTVSYHLDGNTLDTEISVKNRDGMMMYYQLGMHPGFSCPISEEMEFEDYRLEFSHEEMMASFVYDRDHQCFIDKKVFLCESGKTLPLKRELFKDDVLYLRNISSDEVALTDKENSHGVRLKMENFKSLGLWTLITDKASFLCIEPWNGSAIFSEENDIYTDRRDIISLDIGEMHKYGMRITVF